MIRKREADRIPLNPSEDDVFRFVCKARKIYSSAGYDILNIDISKGGEVVARYFADPVTEEYKGHLVGQPWKEAHWVWDEESGEAVARGALHGDIDYWENSIESRNYYDRERRRWQRVQDRINAFMQPTPKGFEEWARELIAGDSAVPVDGAAGKVAEAAGLYIYQCTCCGETWSRKQRRYRTGRKVICPHCGSEIRVERHSRFSEHFYILSVCGDGTQRWYERYIWMEKAWKQTKKKWEYTTIDTCLAVLDGGERFGKCYYREGIGYSESRHNGQLDGFGGGYIYPDFGGAEKYMTGQQVRCLKALAEHGLRVDANRWIMASESNGLECEGVSLAQV